MYGTMSLVARSANDTGVGPIVNLWGHPGSFGVCVSVIPRTWDIVYLDTLYWLLWGLLPTGLPASVLLDTGVGPIVNLWGHPGSFGVRVSVIPRTWDIVCLKILHCLLVPFTFSC